MAKEDGSKVMGLKTICKRAAVIVLLSLMVLFLLYMILRDNIHEVSSGMLYRSAQLTPTRLQRLIHSDHIRTIINLRGKNPQSKWYRHEKSVSQAMGVQHYDIGLSATHLPRPAQLKRLVALFQTSVKPILLHCQGGADRTGFAAAMWLLMHGHSVPEAREAFSILYFVHRSDTIGKQVMPIYSKWLKRHQYKKSNSSRFMEWVSVAKLGT